MSRSTLSIVILAGVFLCFVTINKLYLGSIRIDLTENDLYTLSEGSTEVIGQVDEPVTLYFFFSDKLSEDLTSLRAYSQRVREMLEEYALAANGGIRLEVIDPEPFSEEEDLAAGFGLQSVPVNQAGDELYFGLAGTNSLDGQEVIPFFQPDSEEFLEYEITKLLHSLVVTDKPKVGLYSTLPLDGAVDPQTFQSTDPWIVRAQLEELFSVEKLDSLSLETTSGLDLLVIVHPKSLDESSLFALDQHVMSDGKLLVFVDPFAELDRPATPGMAPPGVTASDINALSSTWGVTLREGQVLGDPGVALMVGDAIGRPVRHLGILGFGSDNLSREDVVTASLESVNVATAGILDIETVDGVVAEPMIVSSPVAGSLDALQFQFLSDPADLQAGFKSENESLPMAVRLSGRATSAFPDGVDGVAAVSGSTDAFQVVIVADTDILSDRLWVQVQDFFGQPIASAFADNGSLITNLVENMSGSSALISVRSRGQFTRPFEVVEQLRRDAEARFLESEDALQAELAETEARLTELESARLEDGLLTLSVEQEAALIRFQDEKLRIRKELRDVRHQLDKDIEALGGRLKFINILLMPLLLTGFLFFLRLMLLDRSGGRSR